MENNNERGFTLLELIVGLLVVCILAMVAIPQVSSYRDKANVASVATQLKLLENAFYAYYADMGDWPDDSHRDVPSGMERLVNQSLWDEETAIGGFFNYEGPDNYPYVGISIYNHTADIELIELLDRMLDDGDLSQGRFRTGTNGRPTLVIEETGS